MGKNFETVMTSHWAQTTDDQRRDAAAYVVRHVGAVEAPVMLQALFGPEWRELLCEGAR